MDYRGDLGDWAEHARQVGDRASQRNVFKLCDQIREAAFAAHRYLRHGHLEKIYENALVHRMRSAGLDVFQQVPLEVLDEDGTQLGHFRADLLVEGILLVEVKACRSIANEHVAQLLGYLRGAHLQHGLLINFGEPKLFIKKYILSDHPIDV